MTSAAEKTLRTTHTERLLKQFSKNMSAFRKKMPDIYNYFIEYQPSAVFIDLDDKGYLNLKNDGQAVYPGNPKEAHRNQFDLFLNRSRDTEFSPNIITRIRPGKGKTFLHDRYLRRIKQLGRAAVSDGRLKNPKFMPALTLLGIGMGYHLEFFMKNYDIQNLIIYEPIPDIFYASLFLIDYKSVLSHFTRGSNTLLIKVDGTPDELCQELRALALQRGSHTISQVTLYQHYNSATTDEALALVQDLSHRLTHGWGFPEDEMMSLAHTAINVSSQTSFIREKASSNSESLAEIPVFIIANGPSLSKDIEFIKSVQDKVIIFAAGSTLVTLYNAGIVPDYQVEIERSAQVKFTHEYLPQAYLEQITLLTLSTTHPSVVNLFPKRAFCLKANDAGSLLISKYLPKTCEAPLGFCNPLAGNGAIAFAIRLGFKNLILFGLDMGTEDPSNHHAAESSYYTEGHKHARHKTPNYKLECKSNNGGKLLTSEIMEYSRFAIENILACNPDVHAKNCSAGLEIKGCEITTSDRLNLMHTLADKTQTLREIESLTFETVKSLEQQAKQDLLSAVNQSNTVSEQILSCIASPSKTIRGTFDRFSNQMEIMNRSRKKHPIGAQFWHGALRYLHYGIANWLVERNDSNETAKYIEQAFQIMRDYIQSVSALFQDNYDIPFGDHNPDDYLTEWHPEQTKNTR